MRRRRFGYQGGWHKKHEPRPKKKNASLGFGVLGPGLRSSMLGLSVLKLEPNILECLYEDQQSPISRSWGSALWKQGFEVLGSASALFVHFSEAQRKCGWASLVDPFFCVAQPNKTQCASAKTTFSTPPKILNVKPLYL